MRKLDELLQDIPLDDLLEGPRENERNEHRSLRLKLMPKKNEETARVSSRTPAAAAAAVIAAAAAIAVVVAAVSIRPASEIRPKTSVSQNQPDPIPGTEQKNELKTSSVSSDTISSSDNRHAQVIYSAMLIYLKRAEQRGDDSYTDAAEITVSFNDTSYDGTAPEEPDLASELEEIIETDVSGHAFFALDGGRLLFAEWSDSPDGSDPEIYPAPSGDSNVSYLGDYPKADDLLTRSEKTHSKDVYLEMMTADGLKTAELSLEDVPWLNEWYESFMSSGHEDLGAAATALDDKEGAVMVYFNIGGEIVTISSADSAVANIAVDGRLFNTSDDSILEKLRAQINESAGAINTAAV